MRTAIGIDGTEFSVRYRGFDVPMYVQRSDGEEVQFQPWTCREHLAALERRSSATLESIHLDDQGIAMDVLAQAGLSGQAPAELIPIALWWAAGGEGPPEPTLSPEGWLDLGVCHVQLNAWTYEQRENAMAANLIPESDGSTRFNPAGYLAAMLERSILSVDPDHQDIWVLDSAATATLLDAVVSLNGAPGLSDQGDEDGPPAMTPEAARDTLEICRHLGWTPSQVSSTAAPEIDKLLELISLAGMEPQKPQITWEGLAANPDAIVIQVDD